MKTKGYYVVWAGRAPGVYSTWDQVSKQVTGFPSAWHAGGFVTLQEAMKAYEGAIISTSRTSRARRKVARRSFNNKEIPGRYSKDEGEAQV